MNFQDKSKEELLSEYDKLFQEFEDFKLRLNLELAERNKEKQILGERLKELQCHNQITRILSTPGLSIDETITQIIQTLPDAWQFPEMAGACISVEKQLFKTKNFVDSRNTLTQDIFVDNRIVGKVLVSYPEINQPGNEPLFLPEETELLASIAVRVGHFIERFEKESALKQTTSDYKKMVESINDVIYEISGNGIIKYVSPAIERILGYKPEEMTDRNFLDFCYEPDRPILIEKLSRLAKNDYNSLEYRLVAKSGVTCWVRSSTTPIFENEQLIAGTGTLTNITNQKNTEIELQKSEALYRSMLAASPDGVTITDLEGKIIFASPRTNELFGLKNAYAALGHSLLEFIDPSDHPQAIDRITKMLQGNLQGAESYKGVRSDGSVFNIEVNGEFIRDATGVPVQMIFATRDITKKKQTEEKLQRTEELFRKLVETINDVIYEVSNDGIVTYVSPAIKNILGYDPDEIIGQNFFDHMYPEDIPLLQHALSELGKKDYSYLEYRYFTKNGDIRWVRSSTVPIIENGVMVGGRGSLNDIHTRKLAEQELRKSEIKYRNIFENIHDVYYEASLEGILLEISPSVNILSKGLYTREELLGQPITNLYFNPDDRNAFFEALRKNGRVTDYEILLKNKDGSVIPVSVSSGFSYDANGHPDRVIGSMRDITERKQAENSLRKLSLAVEQSPVSIVITNLSGNIEYANPKACETTGYTPKEVLGKNPRIWNSGETKAEEYTELWQTISSGKAWHGVFHNKRRNGELYWESTSISPIQDDSGKITHYVAIKEDITESRRIQLALQESQERFRHIAEISRTIICETDADGFFTYISPVVTEILGFQPDQMIGKFHFSDLIPEENRGKIIGYFEKHLAINHYYTPLYNTDKELVWFEMNGVPVFGSDKKFNGYRCGINDITKRKLAEDELRKFRTISDRANYGNAIADLEGRLLYANEAFAGMHGYKVNDIVGKNLSMLHTQEQMIQVGYSIDLLKTQGGFTAMEVWRKRIDGTLFPSLMNAVIIFDDHQQPQYLAATAVDITEKKLADENIRIQNEKLNAIISALPDLIFIFDNQGTYLEFYCSNPDMLLSGKEQIIGKKVSEFFDAQLSDFHLQKLTDCLSKKELISYEYCIGQNNETKYWEARLVPMGNDRILSFVRDITARKQKDSEIKKLSLVVEQSPVSIIITDLDAKMEYVNPALTEISGYNYDELIGENTRILKSGEMKVEIYKDLWDTIKAGKTWQGELLNKKKSGETHWESVSITPIFNETGEITNYLAIKQDITQRKRTEHEIKELNANLELKIQERTAELATMNKNLISEIAERKQIAEALKIKTAELENFFTVALDLLCIANQTGQFVKLNKAWENTLGYKIEDLENKVFLDYVHPDDIAPTIQAMSDLKDNKTIFDFVNRFRKVDGSYRYIEWKSTPVGDKIYAAARDITDRIHANEFENELLQLSTKLTGVSFNEIDAALNLALGRIGQFLNVDRSYIFEYDAEKITMSNSYEWCNEGIPSVKSELQRVPVSTFNYFVELLEKSEIISIHDVNELPDKWKELRDLMFEQQVKSLLVFPILIENKPIGFIGLDAVKTTREFTKSEINTLVVWSIMIASLINKFRSERLVEQTRQNYETFFNTIDDFLWVLDMQGRIVHANNTVRNRLKYTQEELFEKSVMLVYPQERLAEAEHFMGEIIMGKTQFCPVPLQTRDGKIIPVETRTKNGFWNGKPVFFGVSKDISQIQLSEQKFSTAFQSNSAMMAISYFDDGQYVDVNNEFVEVMGFPREEIIGRTNREMGLFVDPNLRSEILESVLNNYPVRKYEIQMRTKDGTVKTGLLSADAIYIGERKCLLTVTMDISDRKKAEEEILKARMEAEQANLAKSEFLSRMSHELRTPMNSILGFAQLLQMGELNQGQKKGVNHILHSGKHLLDLINEVLDISRIEAGRLSLSIEPVQLIGIIMEMIDTVQLLAKERNVTIKLINSPSDFLFVKSDRQRIKQVLLNLINNAIKYNKDGGSVEICTETIMNSSGDPGYLRISITDSGIGISAENLSKLFKPFERIGADKTSIEGSGLGLAVVKKLMEAMGGQLGVESKPGEGSTFWVEFPSSESQLDIAMKSGNLRGSESELNQVSGKILYIEDNLSNIELVDQILTNQRPQIQLITNTHGKLAVQLAIEHQPDLVLLDLNLPDIHGHEVLQLLKSNDKTSAIPVVVISADAMPKQLKQLTEAGARNYLTKPFDIDVFLKIIDEIFAHKK